MDRREFMRLSLAAGAMAFPSSCVKSPRVLAGDELKKRLVETMKAKGAYDVRIADPRGFQHALVAPNPFKVAAPLAIWPECRSVVVVIVPFPPVLDNYLPVGQREDKDLRVYHPLTMRVMSHALPAGAHYLGTQGFKVIPSLRTSAGKLEVQSKLAAYESGLGVYGRSGLLLHRELGNRMVIMTLMTDAELPPDAPDPFKTDCDDCGICNKTCRGKCYRAELRYPESYTVTKCGYSRKEVLVKEGGLCQNCFVNCPAAKKSDQELTAWLQARV